MPAAIALRRRRGGVYVSDRQAACSRRAGGRRKTALIRNNLQRPFAGDCHPNNTTRNTAPVRPKAFDTISPIPGGLLGNQTDTVLLYLDSYNYLYCFTILYSIKHHCFCVDFAGRSTVPTIIFVFRTFYLLRRETGDYYIILPWSVLSGRCLTWNYFLVNCILGFVRRTSIWDRHKFDPNENYCRLISGMYPTNRLPVSHCFIVSCSGSNYWSMQGIVSLFSKYKLATALLD